LPIPEFEIPLSPLHPLHPLPAWRLVKALGRTASVSLQIQLGTAPRHALSLWATGFLEALGRLISRQSLDALELLRVEMRSGRKIEGALFRVGR